MTPRPRLSGGGAALIRKSRSGLPADCVKVRFDYENVSG